MNKTHADEQRNGAGHHQLVFTEEALDANIATADADKNDDEREDGRPPADEQGGIDILSGLVIWRDIGVDATQNQHRLQKHHGSQPLSHLRRRVRVQATERTGERS